MSKWLKSLKEHIALHICLAVTFITTGIIVDIIQALLTVLVKPWRADWFRRINYYVTYCLNSQMVFIVEWWSGSRAIMFSDPAHVKKYFGKEPAMLLLNHTYEIDWLIGWVVCDRCQILGNAKVFVKKILQYAPVLGWSWKMQEIVFLERNWEKDKVSLGGQLAKLAAYPNPYWVVLFPEGTRYTKDKHKISMEVARSKGLPELKHHLLPRTRGFVASIPHLRKTMPAVYDVTVAFNPMIGNEPTVFNMLNGRPVTGTLLLRRIPMSEIPEDETKAAEWLHELYRHKDKCLENFFRTGEFNPPDNRLPEYEKFEYIELPRRYYSLINMTFWFLIICGPLVYYITGMFLSGDWTLITVAFLLVILAYVGMDRLINLTKISKGSNYGENANGKMNSIGNGDTNSKKLH
ncbi:unnamed protein product [Allacma fusca]|uniref:Phospholipid/glycerol acyltransferase domain-containing protein n=1 Tax=Allacma fusca TaxID=39272 RepID=A0A8J2NSP4_9HEXA|nr:unnamed protein product [Allacma fusca]